MRALLIGCVWASTVTVAAPQATGLTAEYRAGQTFLTWAEPAGQTPHDESIRLQVRMSPQPIGGDEAWAAARVAGDYLRPGSATDWWLNPEFSGKPLPAGAARPAPAGWRLASGGPRLDPASGLFVHTVTAATSGGWYYAVRAVDPASGEAVEPLRLGVNATATAVGQTVAPLQPIWQGDGPAPDPSSGAGKPLELLLHAKSGAAAGDWLVFGPAELGWQDGLPFKFEVRVTADAVRVQPTDQHWIGRILTNRMDAGNALDPSIWTFWYGYNSRIFDPAQMAAGQPVNYTERRLLWLLEWVQRVFATDPHRTYCTGSSMGGCGTMSFAWRHPEIFAAVAAQVPIVTYRAGAGGDSERRMSAYTGPFDQVCSSGLTLREQLDAARFVATTTADLPPLVIVNGRQDGSIPWWVNPPFYRAVQAARQPMIAAWNEGDHANATRLAPADIRERLGYGWLHRFARNQAYLALTGASCDDDPGDGNAASGDPVGFINHGLDWTIVADEPGWFACELVWYLDDDLARLPVRVDVTPRRVQQAGWQPGQTWRLTITERATGATVAQREVQVGADGLLTVGQVELNQASGVRLDLRR